MNRRALLAALATGLASTALPRIGMAQTAVQARIGVIPIIGAAPLFVAAGEGYLKEKGIGHAITTFESGPNMIQALASGTIDIYVAGVAPLAVARAKGVDVKVVASTAVGENVFIASPKLSQLFASSSSKAEAFKAFRAATGKPARLATQPAGSVPNTTLQYWLWEVAKADKADVEIVAMGIDATQQAFLAGAVDGASVREPAVSIITGRKPDARLIALGDDLFPGQPGTVIGVHGAFLAKNPDAVQSIVASLIRAADLLVKSPDKAQPHVEAALGKGIVDPAVIKAALVSKATKFEIDPRKIIGPTSALQAYQVKLGSLEKELPLDGLFETSFYEKAIAGK